MAKGNRIPGSTDAQSLALSLFTLLFPVDFLSTATGIEFSQKEKKGSTN